MPDLIDHMEKYLGPLQGRVPKDFDGKHVDFQVIWFDDAPEPGAITLCTLGLSHHFLQTSDPGRDIRQELVFICYERYRKWNLPGVLRLIGQETIDEHEALLRGDVIGPRGKLFPTGEIEALYLSNPWPVDQGFWAYEDIALCWLVPITAAEAALRRQEGWKALEQRFQERDPDILDLDRPSVA